MGHQSKGREFDRAARAEIVSALILIVWVVYVGFVLWISVSTELGFNIPLIIIGLFWSRVGFMALRTFGIFSARADGSLARDVALIVQAWRQPPIAKTEDLKEAGRQADLFEFPNRSAKVREPD